MIKGKVKVTCAFECVYNLNHMLLACSKHYPAGVRSEPMCVYLVTYWVNALWFMTNQIEITLSAFFFKSLTEGKMVCLTSSFHKSPRDWCADKDKTETPRCFKYEELTNEIKPWEQMKDNSQHVSVCVSVRSKPFLQAVPKTHCHCSLLRMPSVWIHYSD